jgi:hypothetical protein
MSFANDPTQQPPGLPQDAGGLVRTHVVYVHGICKHAVGFSDSWWTALQHYLPGLVDANRHEVVWSDVIEPGPPEPELARASRRLNEALALTRPVSVSGKAAVAAQIKDVLADRATRQLLAATLQTTARGGSAAVAVHPNVEAVGPQALLGIPGVECVEDFADYLFDSNIRGQVIDRFNRVVQPLLQQAGTIVHVVSHSWGTVVAYEALRGLDPAGQFGDGAISTLFTVGSALSIAPIKRMLLPGAIDGLRPRLVQTWVNLNAQFDIVGGHLQNNPFQVDAEYLELPPVGCSTLIPNPVCAHSSYFNLANQAVNQDIFARYIQALAPSLTAPALTQLGDFPMPRRRTNPPSPEPTPSPSVPAPPPAAGGQGRLIQFDPHATAATPSVAQVQPSADTISPHDDWKHARDEMERKLGGHRARVAAFAAAATDTAGRENIVGFAVGLRYASNSLTGHLAVKVFVRDKLPLDRVAPSARVPTQIAGFPTDVEAIGEIILHSYAQRYPRPVPCGVSISNVDLAGSGTLGCLVVLNNGKLCILSNNHVLANENAAQLGDAIIQPGNAEPVDAPDQVIGALENFIPIQATGNLVDAAVALTSFAMVSPKHVSYQLTPAPVVPTIGMTVVKDGRTTQSTVGMVTDLHVNISVGYEPFPAGAEMRDQVGIRGIQDAFSKPGDSGSLIVTAGTKQPVALLFAGSNDNSVTFGNPIQAVMAALGINRFVAQPE